MTFKIIMATLIVGFVGLVSVLAISGKLGKSVTNSNIASTLSATESQYDFGTISMKDGDVYHDFTIKNTGVKQVTVSKLSTSCMCTKASLTAGDKTEGPFSMEGHGGIPKIDVAIPAGGEASVEAIYDPTAHGSSGIGRIERSIFVDSTDGARTELKFKVMVTP